MSTRVLNCVIQTLGLSGSSGKGFDNIHDAQEWLTGFQFGLSPVTTIHTSKHFQKLMIEHSLAELGDLILTARHQSQLECIWWGERRCRNLDGDPGLSS